MKHASWDRVSYFAITVKPGGGQKARSVRALWLLHKWSGAEFFWLEEVVQFY